MSELPANAETRRGRRLAAMGAALNELTIVVAFVSMQARGKASLGDKTVLDALEAASAAAAGLDEPGAILAAAKAAVARTMDEFRGREAKIGRARIFAEKSVGLDDPGMLALRRVIEAL